MSEPVSNAEIEDVLSAVRRLVSESGGAKREPMEEGQTALVLTPAFRVDDRAREPEAEVSVEDLVHETLAEVEEAVSEPELAASETSGDRETNGAPFKHVEDISAEVEALLAYRAPQSEEHAHTEPDHAEPQYFNSDQAEPVVAPDDEILRTLEDRIAELEAVVSDEQHEWEPDGSEAADAPDTIVFRHAGAEAAVTDDNAAVAEVEIEAPMVDVVDVDDADNWEDVSGEDMSFAEVHEETDEEPLDTYEYATETPEFVAPEAVEDDGDDLVIDEDMLREIVARLVREELQGTMGERITRNLRRMVRREIARALALKDFD